MPNHLTSTAMIMELSSRIKRYRIDYPLTQKELAEKSGVSLRSISRFEKGEDIQFSNFIKILRTLGLEENLFLLVPDSQKRPSYHLNDEKTRKRARTKKADGGNRNFKWGDEI